MWTRNTFIGMAIGFGMAFVVLLALVGIYAIATTALDSNSAPTTAQAEREEPEVKTKEETKAQSKQKTQEKAQEKRASNESADADISLSGPGDATTPPTYLEKGTLIIDMEHAPSEDAPDEWSYNQFVVQVNDSEGKIVAGSYVWQEGPYQGSRSVAIPEGGTYTIQVKGHSPWSVAATHYPET
jgi:hypothetical protein